MAHLKHYHRSGVKDILEHNKRENNYSNQDIDPKRSKYNYSLSGHEDDFEYYKQRLSEVHCLNRANVNTLSSWVVTLPKGIKQEDQKKFFQETVNFLKDRYGEKNVVSADVHFDETTPHLHFTFIPVVWDEKKNREKVDRKSIFTIKELKTFHNSLQNHLQSVLGYDPKVMTGEMQKRKNISISELKSRTQEMYLVQQDAINKLAITQKEFDTACKIDFKALYGKFPFIFMRRKFAQRVVEGVGSALAVKDAEKYLETRIRDFGVSVYEKRLKRDTDYMTEQKMRAMERKIGKLEEENQKLKDLLKKFVPNVFYEMVEKIDQKIKKTFKR